MIRRMVFPPKVSRVAVLVTALAALGGCVGMRYGGDAYDADRMPGTAEVASSSQFVGYNYLKPVSGYQEAVSARIDELAKAPMTEAAAVEVALLRDGDVRGLLQDHWSQRPSFVRDVAARVAGGEDPRPTEWQILGELLSRSTTRRWGREFGEEYLETAEAMTARVGAARIAYYEAVAAAQCAAMFDQTLDAEKAGAELANEQYRSGTASRLDQAERHMASAETFKAAAITKRDAVAAREALNRELKLWGGHTTWALPDRLPELPAARPVLENVEAYAATNSIDAYTSRAGATQLEAGAMLRSEVREAYNHMLVAYDMARYQRDVVVPLTQVGLEEMQLNYNAMLQDAYQLLGATREQIEAGTEYIETAAEFWIARADLTQKLGGRLPEPASAAMASAASAVAAPTAN